MIQSLASKRRKLTKDLVNRTKTGKIAFFMFFSRKKPAGRTDRRIKDQQMPKLDKINIKMNRMNFLAKRKLQSSKTFKKIEQFRQENPDRAKDIANKTTKAEFKMASAPMQLVADYNQEMHKVETSIINTQYKADMAILEKLLKAFEESSKDIKEIREETKKIEEIQRKIENLESKVNSQKDQKGTETIKNIPELNQFKELLNSIDKKVDEIKGKELSFDGIYTELNNHYDQIKASHDSILDAVGMLPTKTEITKLAETIANYNKDILTAQAAIKESIEKLSNIDENVKKTLENFSNNFVNDAIKKFNEGADTLTKNFKQIAGGVCAEFGEFKKDDPDPSGASQRVEELEKLKNEVVQLIKELKSRKETDEKILKSNEEYLKNINNAISQIGNKVENINVTIPTESLEQYIKSIAQALYIDLSNDFLNEQTQNLKQILEKTISIDDKTNILNDLQAFMDQVILSLAKLATETSVLDIKTKLDTTNVGVETSNEGLTQILGKVNELTTIIDTLDKNLFNQFNRLDQNIFHVSEASKESAQLVIDMVQQHNHFSLESFKDMYNTLAIEVKKDFLESNLMAEYRLGIINNNIQQISSEYKKQHREISELIGDVIGTVEVLGVNVQEQIYNAVAHLDHSVQSSSMMLSQQIRENRELIEHLGLVIQDNLDYLLNNFIESHEQLTDEVIKATERSFFHYYLQVGHDISEIEKSFQQQNEKMREYISGAADNVNKMLYNLGIYTQDLKQELENIRNAPKTGSVMDQMNVNLTMPQWFNFLFPLRKYNKLQYLKKTDAPTALIPFELAQPIGEIMEIPVPNEDKSFVTEVVPSTWELIPEDPVLQKIAVDNTPHTTVVFDAVEHVATSMFDRILKPFRINNDIILLNPFNIKLESPHRYNLKLEQRREIFEKNEFVRNMAATIGHYLKQGSDIDKIVAEEKLKLALGDEKPDFYGVYNGELIYIDYGTAGRLIYHLGVVVNGVRNVFRRKHAFDKKYPDRVHQLPVMVKYEDAGIEKKTNLSLEEVGGANMEMFFYNHNNYIKASNAYMAYVICILACMVAFLAYGVVSHVFNVMHQFKSALNETKFAAVIYKAAATNDEFRNKTIKEFNENRFISMDIMRNIAETRKDRPPAYQLDMTNNYFEYVQNETHRLIAAAA